MRRAKVFADGILAGHLVELEKYQGPSISLTMPVKQKKYCFDQFPPFFDGFLPEGLSNLKRSDLLDYFGKQRLSLSESFIEEVLARFQNSLPKWREMIECSFLSPEKKKRYLKGLEERAKRIFS
ncbi:MAG TPA: HipA N-terminal domain-containing protein [Chlamydiales bacterium]|jgi:serine/threonine-protein kinase HipA|nr:HipA N-terminal domain-containing protein [Chlamydiales bacterium]